MCGPVAGTLAGIVFMALAILTPLFPTQTGTAPATSGPAITFTAPAMQQQTAPTSAPATSAPAVQPTAIPATPIPPTAVPPTKAPAVQQQPPPPTATTAAQDQTNGATALCNDGTLSYAKTHSGACSKHGGVKTFYK